MPGKKFQTERSSMQPCIFKSTSEYSVAKQHWRLLIAVVWPVLKRSTILFHNNLWSLRIVSFSVRERHVCPIKTLLIVTNPVSGFTKNKNKMWSDCWTHPQGWRPERVSCMHASSHEIAWWSLHVKGTSACCWSRSLGSNVARNSPHPSQASSDVHCQVDKLILEERQQIISGPSPPPPSPFPQMEDRCSKACSELTPRREKDLCSLVFNVPLLQKDFSQHLLLCLEGTRQYYVPSTRCQ